MHEVTLLATSGRQHSRCGGGGFGAACAFTITSGRGKTLAGRYPDRVEILDRTRYPDRGYWVIIARKGRIGPLRSIPP